MMSGYFQSTAAEGPAAQQTSQRPALVALVTGILALATGWLPYIGVVLGIAAIVLGISARRKRQRKLFTLIGITTGILGLLLSLYATLSLLTGFNIAMLFNENPINSAKLTEADAPSQDRLDAKKDFAAGETGHFGYFDVTADDVKRDYTSTDVLPRNGYEFVSVKITVKNVTKDLQSFSPSELTLIADDKNVGASIDSDESAFPEGDIEAGASKSGFLIFEAPTDTKKLKLQYQTVIMDILAENTEQLTYTLELKS